MSLENTKEAVSMGPNRRVTYNPLINRFYGDLDNLLASYASPERGTFQIFSVEEKQASIFV